MGDLKISRPTGSYPPSSARAIQAAGKLMLGEGCKATARSFGREPCREGPLAEPNDVIAPENLDRGSQIASVSGLPCTSTTVISDVLARARAVLVAVGGKEAVNQLSAS